MADRAYVVVRAQRHGYGLRLSTVATATTATAAAKTIASAAHSPTTARGFLSWSLSDAGADASG